MIFNISGIPSGTLVLLQGREKIFEKWREAVNRPGPPVDAALLCFVSRAVCGHDTGPLTG